MCFSGAGPARFVAYVLACHWLVAGVKCRNKTGQDLWQGRYRPALFRWLVRYVVKSVIRHRSAFLQFKPQWQASVSSGGPPVPRLLLSPIAIYHDASAPDCQPTAGKWKSPDHGLVTSTASRPFWLFLSLQWSLQVEKRRLMDHGACLMVDYRRNHTLWGRKNPHRHIRSSRVSGQSNQHGDAVIIKTKWQGYANGSSRIMVCMTNKSIQAHTSSLASSSPSQGCWG